MTNHNVTTEHWYCTVITLMRHRVRLLEWYHVTAVKCLAEVTTTRSYSDIHLSPIHSENNIKKRQVYFLPMGK